MSSAKIADGVPRPLEGFAIFYGDPQEFATVIINNSKLRLVPTMWHMYLSMAPKIAANLWSSEAILSQNAISATRSHHQDMDQGPHAVEVDLDLHQEKSPSASDIYSRSAKEVTTDFTRKEAV